jgi:Flp pilus assembly protein TadB
VTAGVVSPLLLAAAATVAVLLWVPPPPVRRVRASRSPRWRPGPRVAAAVAGPALALLVGGWAGLLLGVAAAVAVLVVTPRLESRGEVARREALERQAPLVVDLVAACLASGAPLLTAVEASAAAVGPPASGLLGDAAVAIRLGADPREVWAAVGEVECLDGLARSVRRSLDTGAPLADLLPRVAAAARGRSRTRAQARVRTAAVRLTAPLGLAFLPSFVLLGVVPVVASWVGLVL